MDTLFTICINPPLHPGTGGSAYYRPPPTVSRRSRWGKRLETDDELSGEWDVRIINPPPHHPNAIVFEKKNRGKK